MSEPIDRTYRVGGPITYLCRACKVVRDHTVMAIEGGRPVRVVCDFCRSEHNFRGGARMAIAGTQVAPTSTRPARPASAAVSSPALPLVGEREISEPAMSDPSGVNLEALLRRIIREETGITPVTPAEKWRGGTLVLRPGNPQLQDKSWPIETFFHKVVMLRNRLRTLEQQINATDLPEDVKIKVQGYISGCYGSLTSFNILFADEADQFKGSSGD